MGGPAGDVTWQRVCVAVQAANYSSIAFDKEKASDKTSDLKGWQEWRCLKDAAGTDRDGENHLILADDECRDAWIPRRPKGRRFRTQLPPHQDLHEEIFAGISAICRYARGIIQTVPIDPQLQGQSLQTPDDTSSTTSRSITPVAKPQASQRGRDSKRDSRDAKEEEYNPKQRRGDAGDRLICKALDRYDLSITEQEDARLKPYQRAIRIAFKTHEKEGFGWEMEASKALEDETNAILYRGRRDR